jgi:hypothetical protein
MNFTVYEVRVFLGTCLAKNKASGRQTGDGAISSIKLASPTEVLTFASRKCRIKMARPASVGEKNFNSAGMAELADALG